LGIALANYAVDYKAYPLMWYLRQVPPPFEPNVWWHSELHPYSGANWSTNLHAGIADSASQLYLCPSYARAVGVVALWPNSSQSDNSWAEYGAYGYNWYGTDAGVTENGVLGLGGGSTTVDAFYQPPTKENDVLNPSQMVAIGDANFGPWLPTGENPKVRYAIVFNSSFGIDFGRLDAQQIVNLTIIARNYPLEDSGKRGLTARERFDQYSDVIKPGSTN